MQKPPLPALVMLLVACIVGLLFISGCDTGSVKSRLEADVSSSATSFDYAVKTPFSWDRMFVFDCYTSQANVESTLGFQWPDYRKTTIGSSDSVCLVVFVQDGKVVHWYEQPRSIELGWLANGKGYSRSKAKFRVSRAGGRAELQQIKIIRPASEK